MFNAKIFGVSKRYLNFFKQVSTKVSNLNKPTGGYLLLIVPATTFCLGTWQVKRRQWKLDLIEEVERKHSAAPIPLPDDLTQLKTMEYQRVEVTGKFDHEKEVYIGPRRLMKNDDSGGSIFSTQPNNGYLVVTPFLLSNKQVPILVNRGWVPKSKLDPSKRPEGQVKGEVTLVGTVRLEEKRPPFGAKQKPGTKSFFYRDVPKMADMTGAEPVFLDAEGTVQGGPIGGQTRITFRNEHLSYIITWYSLSAATSYMWYKRYFRKLRP